MSSYFRRPYLFKVKSHQLHTLDLSGGRLKDTSYLSILMNCKESLKNLNTSKCTNVGDDISTEAVSYLWKFTFIS